MEAVCWWAEFLPVAAPWAVAIRPRPPVFAYADAEGSGHISAVLLDGCETPSFVPHTHAPRCMLDPVVGRDIGIRAPRHLDRRLAGYHQVSPSPHSRLRG